MTEKLVPSFESADVESLSAPLLVTMFIWFTDDPNEPIDPGTPPIVAKQVFETPVLSEPKSAVPKFANGSTPNIDEGASTIHSAEDSVAPDWLPVVVKVHASVLSFMTRVNVPLEYVTLAKTLSPGFTVAAAPDGEVAVVILIIDSRG